MKNLLSLINKICEDNLQDCFNKEKYLYEFEDNHNDILIDIAIKSAKLIILGDKNSKEKSKKYGIIRDISNYLRHSGNAVSRPIIALDFNLIFGKI